MCREFGEAGEEEGVGGSMPLWIDVRWVKGVYGGTEEVGGGVD